MNKLAELSEAQMEIMQVVWEHGETTVALVLKELRQRRQLSRNTVQTMLSRLDKKGWLDHRQDGNTFYYCAAVPRDQALRDVTGRLVDTAFAGSPEGLVMALLGGRGLSKKEAERIQEMIDEAGKGKKS